MLEKASGIRIILPAKLVGFVSETVHWHYCVLTLHANTARQVFPLFAIALRVERSANSSVGHCVLKSFSFLVQPVTQNIKFHD